MKQHTRLLCLLLATLLLLSGCGSGAATGQADSSAQSDTSAADAEATGSNTTGETDETEESDDNGDAEEYRNPFDTSGEIQESEIIGELQVGPVTPYVDEEGNGVAIEYTGGELALDYYAWGYGTGSAFGLLLFVDGEPQPFYTDSDSEVAYMHFFTTGDDDGIGDDDDSVYFTLHFTPVTGQAGDTLTLTVCAINNAQYQPDMVETTNYAGYHNSLETCPHLHIAATPETVDWADTVEAMTNVSVTTALMTEEFLAGQDYEEEQVEAWMCCLIYYDGNVKYDNLDITGQETVHITLQIYGGPAGSAYCVTCFANHHVLTDGENVTQKITVGKNEVVSLEFDLETSQLENLTTFYAYVCPVSANDDQLGRKTMSILLYQTD